MPLLGRGDSASGAYLVLSGTLRVYHITDEGREAFRRVADYLVRNAAHDGEVAVTQTR